MNLSELLEKQSKKYADKVFLHYEKQTKSAVENDGSNFKQTLSYKEFDRQVNRASHYLSSLNLGKGDVYNLHLPNCPAFLILWFAGIRLGAVMMPTNMLASEIELSWLLSHSGSRISFTTTQNQPVVERCKIRAQRLQHIIICDPDTNTPLENSFESKLSRYSHNSIKEKNPKADVNASDLAAIMYTSGTTSKPKGVMVTHDNYLKAGTTVADALEISEQDRHLVVLPMFHGNAQYYSTMSTLISGASMVLMDRFSASQYFDKCRQYNCTVSSLFAAPIRMILAQPENACHGTNSLRVVIYAQNITEEQTKDWHRRFNAPLCQLWGMTETMGPPLMNPLRGERKNWTVGKPVGGYEVQLVNQTGDRVSPGTAGEIIVRGLPGETIMAGYFNNPEATQATIRNGWLHTGDNAIQDKDGYFRFVDRLKDMIKRSGENVSAGEVESVLLLHPAVFECAVIGLNDKIRDQRIAAVVVCKSDQKASARELIEFCREHLASFRVPEIIIFKDQLPKTSVGKIQKNLIRTELEDDKSISG
jgi:crotonobetaine/carnitine-CoA ligase